MGLDGPTFSHEMTTRPIKGMRPRAEDSEEDRRLAAELAASEKDAAESGFHIIGRVEQEPRLGIDAAGARPIDLTVRELEDAWRSPLAFGEGQ